MSIRSWAWAALGLLLLPAAAQAQAAATVPAIHDAGPAPVHLYFHVAAARQDFPINTQRPSPAFALSSSTSAGLGQQSLRCEPAVPASSATSGNQDTWYGYGSPALVDYNTTDNGSPRIAPERGLLADVQIDPASHPVLDWYISTSAAIPAVVAQATLRTGERITLDNEGYNIGVLVAQGRTAPTNLLVGQALGMDGQPNPQVTAENGGPGQPAIYGFHIPLTLHNTTLPRAEGYSVRIDLFISRPQCDGEPAGHADMVNVVSEVMDARHLPGMQLMVLDPLQIQYLHPQFLGDDMVFHAAVVSPFGAYDVGGVDFAVQGSDGPVPGILRVPGPTAVHEHSYHPSALAITYVWPYRPAAAKDGVYTVHLQAANLQGTSKAQADTTFEVGKTLWATSCGIRAENALQYTPDCIRQQQDANGNVVDGSLRAPAMSVAWMAASLAGLAFLRRRRA